MPYEALSEQVGRRIQIMNVQLTQQNKIWVWFIHT